MSPQIGMAIEEYLNSQQAYFWYKLGRILQFMSLVAACIGAYWYNWAVYAGLSAYFAIQFCMLGLKPFKHMQCVVKKLLQYNSSLLKRC